MNRLSTRDIASAVLTGSRSALSVADEVLSRIDSYQSVQPQAWISRVPHNIVRDAARVIDVSAAAGASLPLAGVPFAVKDNIDVAGVPTTAGCPDFAYMPAHNATIVQRLLDAGAMFIGKTNLDQFATGLVGTRSPYGAPRCVYNLAYVSGGSSSGSAVVTAAGLVAFALGTDTAGSGRVPAAFNGLVGFKPTKGRWSTSGLVPACRTLDCISVFVEAAEDALLIDDVVAGFDTTDAYSRPLKDKRTGNRIGVALASQLDLFGDAEARNLYAVGIANLKAMGHSVVEIDIASLLEVANLLYDGPWKAERTATVGDFLERSPGSFDPVVRDILDRGKAVSGVDTFMGQYRLAELARSAELIWESIDVLALPTTTAIYRVREIATSPLVLNANLGRYTNFVNLLDLSAVAIPAGFRRNGTGFGITLMAQAWRDRALLNMAARYQNQKNEVLPDLDLEDSMEMIELAVVGAHLRDMPLHWQLTSRAAEFVEATFTAPVYRLFAMTESMPSKPALFRDKHGSAIAVEVYKLNAEAFGSFVAEVPPPLAIGTLELLNGRSVKGFVAEPLARLNASDITSFGGWRAYLESQSASEKDRAHYI
jgi:allophanate hydrolase